MYVETTKKVLLPLLRRAKHFTETNRYNNFAQLGAIGFNISKDGSLNINATNLDQQFSETLQLAPGTFKPGKIRMPVATLFSIMKAIKSDGFTMSVDAEFNVEIIDDKLTHSLCGVEDDMKPQKHTLSKIFEVGIDTLMDKMNTVAKSQSHEETRYYLNGIMFETFGEAKNILRMVATDGHIMTIADLNLPKHRTVKDQIIVPREAIERLQKVIDIKDSKISMSINSEATRIVFTIDGNKTITTKLVDGTFPDYHRVVPDGYGASLTFDSEAISAILERLLDLTQDKLNHIKIRPSETDAEFSVSTVDGFKSSGNVDCEISGETEKDLVFGTNALHLLNAARGTDESRFTIHLIHGSTHGVIGGPVKLANPDNESVYHFLMLQRAA